MLASILFLLHNPLFFFFGRLLQIHTKLTTMPIHFYLLCQPALPCIQKNCPCNWPGQSRRCFISLCKIPRSFVCFFLLRGFCGVSSMFFWIITKLSLFLLLLISSLFFSRINVCNFCGRSPSFLLLVHQGSGSSSCASDKKLFPDLLRWRCHTATVMTCYNVSSTPMGRHFAVREPSVVPFWSSEPGCNLLHPTHFLVERPRWPC